MKPLKKRRRVRGKRKVSVRINHSGKEERSNGMKVLSPGSLVQITNDGAFRGLKGTIRTVDMIPSADHEEPFCFYLVAVEGAWMKEPVWFGCDEVEEITTSPVARSQQNSRVPTR